MVSNLGLSGVSLLYRWKAKLLEQSGPAAATLENRVRQLEDNLRRVERERDILKKGLGHFQPEDIDEVYTVINQLEEGFPVSLLCETLSASRSAYYAWRQGELGLRRREDNRLMPTIRSVFWEHRRRYGARRIAAELAARNEPCRGLLR